MSNKAIIGRKVGMTQVFTADGKMLPVTVVEAGPCPIVQIKTMEKDGYTALKLGFIETKKEKLNKPELGLFEKTGIAPQKVLKEVRTDDVASYEVGAVVTADIFQAGDKVDVVGMTKGHGFSGVIKRWNQHRLMASHGVGPVHREVGSMGANSSPSRVFKHKKLPGHYGVERVTVQNLEVVKVDLARNVLLIKGSVPGAKGAVVTISNSVKSK